MSYTISTKEENLVNPVCFLGRRRPHILESTLKMKEFAPGGANSFLKELISIEKGSKTENDRVASPESVSIHLNVSLPSFNVYEKLLRENLLWGEKSL